MRIRFLRNCDAPQNYTQVRCECCGPEPAGSEMTHFFPGDEEDPEVLWNEIDLTGLTINVDFLVIEL